MRKLVMCCFLLLAAVGYGLYAWLFGPGHRVRAQLPGVKPGMSSAAVTGLLGVPDTTYVWPQAPYPLIFHYDMGPGAPDAVRVFLDHDTVTVWSYDQ